MDVIRHVPRMKEIARRARAEGRRIGFVPTMGYLHEGHMSLVRRVKDVSDVTVVSVFVNPTQFEPGEDFERYPRNLSRDADLLIREGVDHLFAPDAEDLYARGSSTFVEVERLSAILEGASRQGHFRGVATVVLKLFEVVRPDLAAFGQKDAQQAIIVQRMVRDLLLDVEILVLPIVRDEDGLALSSRNVLLSPEERRAARAIPRCLEAGQKAVESGERDPARVVHAALDVLSSEPLLKTDYLELVDPRELQPVMRLEGAVLLAVAVWAGRTRLIDNTVIRV